VAEAAFEKHYRVNELAGLWSLSTDTIIRLFRNEPGVLHIHNPTKEGKRRYDMLSIPENVASRIHERLSRTPLGQQTFETLLPRRNPLRVIRFRDLNARVPQKARHVLKRNAA